MTLTNRLTNRWSIAKGNTLYKYDPANNLTNIIYPSSPAIALEYNLLNELTNMNDAAGTTAFTWDAVRELTSENGPWANDTVSYTYANRLRTGMSLSQPSSSWSQSYGYDTARRLTNVVSPAGAFNYTLGGASSASPLMKTLSLPNGAYITNSFDSVARLLSTKLLNSSSSVLDSESYAYNQAGQRTGETNTAGDFRNYTYDNAGELKTAIGKEAGGTTNRWQEQLGYAYDAAGNLNYRTNNGLLGAFSVNNLNELTTVTNGGRLTVAGTTTIPATSVTVNSSNAILYADATFAATNMPLINGTNTFTAIGQDSYGHSSTNVSICYLPATNSFSYDLNGNLLSDTNRCFAYDDENQLTSVWVTNVWREDFVYDGKFRRRIEKDFAWQSGAWVETNEIRFIYDGNFVIQERNGSNIPQVTYTRSGSSLLARSDYGQEIPGSPTTAYYHMDGNGNVTMLIYANQIVAAKYLYGPFGETLSLSGPLAPFNTYRFASKEWNDRGGIYYFGRRYYDPILIRFLNRDPIAEQGGLNLYAYLGNNPINLIDILGLCPPSLWDQWWLNIYNNWEQNSLDYANGIGQAGENLANTAWNTLNDPLGTVANLGTWAGNVSTDLLGYAENYGNNLLNGLGTSQGIGGTVFGLETGLATGGFASALAPEAEASGLTAADVSANLTPADQLAIGQATHEAAVAQYIAQVESEGGAVLGNRITIYAGGSRAVPDLLIQNADSSVNFVEIKTGGAQLSSQQEVVYPLIEQGGAVPAGGNAARAGLTPSIPLPPMQVITIHFP